MSTHTQTQHPDPNSSTSVARSAARPETLTRVAVGVDHYPEGQDAAALGALIARASGGELLLVAVQQEPLVILPKDLDRASLKRQSRELLARTRDEFAPHARITVESDHSVAGVLHHVVQRERRDLLVMGSSRHTVEGRVRIGKRTRQLLCNFDCALAVAPRGFAGKSDPRLARIGVGYDGTPESEAALAFAGSLAASAGAELEICGVIDDRMPTIGWGYAWVGDMADDWRAVVRSHLDSLRDQAIARAKSMGLAANVTTTTGRPADALLDVSGQVDLLVIGSRRWGPAKRLLLGSTGEAVLHDALCPVLTVPRPAG